ncbi:MAG: hydroxymethylpyrimidine/phosphomethylpyrimidine kinase [Sterolibacterium sp.]|jgi:hydroxymethylpyrimidine/phosphomethylpyrimidine kinase|nr:hydroxymethylpyrimidine/phosphomethylpyrimidine kinase [Sterolibacterium sp.]
MPPDASDFLPPIVLSFAASDPTGGAGIQADLLTLAALGCHPLSVITALTVQDTAGVEDILPIDDEWITDQARALLEDIPVAAFKLGMLGSLENIVAIASIVSDYPDIPLILDPVLASGRGDALANEDMVDAMLQLLLPQTTIITPNSLEARRLTQDDDSDDADDPDDATGRSEDDEEETCILSLADCARRLIGAGSELVLITGTHENTAQVVNTLYGSHGAIRSDKWQRLPGSYHGSGCTLASAIAANLAHGMDAIEAVRGAQEYTWRTLARGFRPGMGQHIPDRFFWARSGIDDSDADHAGEPEPQPPRS